MASLLNQQRKAMIEDALARNPQLVSVKSFIKISLTCFVSVRLLFSALETYIILSSDMPHSLGTTNFISAILALLFSFGIYRGYKAFIYLPLVGGVFSLFSFFSQINFSESMQKSDDIFKLYLIILIGGAFF